MRIDFDEVKCYAVENMNGGKGEVKANMAFLKNGKVMRAVLPPKCEIGEHIHETSDDINYVLSGRGTAICDGVEEKLEPGILHICPMGHRHFIRNDGTEDLVLLTIVPEIKHQ